MSARVEVRPAVVADLDALVALERATGNAPHWPPANYAAILDELEGAPERCLFVAQTADSLAGFAVGLLHPGCDEERIAELESIVVAECARRAGTGRRLCAAVFDWCCLMGAIEVVLEVRASSAGAVALYTSLGFTHCGRRPGYYRDPDDDALMMRLNLDE